MEKSKIFRTFGTMTLDLSLLVQACGEEDALEIVDNMINDITLQVETRINLHAGKDVHNVRVDNYEVMWTDALEEDVIVEDEEHKKENPSSMGA